MYYVSPIRFAREPYSQPYCLISPLHKERYDLLAKCTWWIGDNGAFKHFDEVAFYRMLEKTLPYQENCRFIVAPDVLLDARATLRLYGQHAERIRKLGYKVAYVAQNGSESLTIPDCDALFLGGNNVWRDMEHSKNVMRVFAQARSSNLWIHVGRVNSWRRIQHFTLLGADSCDGTHLSFSPEQHLPTVRRWRYQTQPMFILEE